MTTSAEYTDKSQKTLTEAIQLARDHAHVQGMLLPFLLRAETYNTLLYFQFTLSTLPLFS